MLEIILGVLVLAAIAFFFLRPKPTPDDVVGGADASKDSGSGKKEDK